MCALSPALLSLKKLFVFHLRFVLEFYWLLTIYQSGRVLRLLVSQTKRTPMQKEASKKRASASRTQTGSARPSCLYSQACRQAGLGNTDAALNFLDKAIRLGFRDTSALTSDPALDNLRSNEAFKALVFESKITNKRKLAVMNRPLLTELHEKVPEVAPVSHSPQTFAQNLMRELKNNSPALRHQQVPAVNPSQCSGRVGLLREIENFHAKGSPASPSTPCARVSLMQEIRKNVSPIENCLTTGRRALLHQIESHRLGEGSSISNLSTRQALLQELKNHQLQLNHCEVPTVNPSQRCGRAGLIQEIENFQSTKNFGTSCKASPKTVPCASNDVVILPYAALLERQNQLLLNTILAPRQLKTPGRLPFTKKPYNSTVASYLTVRQRLVKEIHARVPLIN